MDYWYSKVQEKRSSKYRTSVRLVGACHIALGEACLGAYPGVGAFHSTRQNSYLGAYPGYYGNSYRHCFGGFYMYVIQKTDGSICRIQSAVRVLWSLRASKLRRN